MAITALNAVQRLISLTLARCRHIVLVKVSLCLDTMRAPHTDTIHNALGKVAVYNQGRVRGGG